MTHGEQSLGQVPALLCKVLKEKAWQDFETPLGKLVHHDRFEDFVVAPAPEGLSAKVEDVSRIIRGNREAEDLLDQALQRSAYIHMDKDDDVNNVNVIKRPQGNSSDRALRHLREKRPELHQRVLSGELSPHAAMIEAGFRSRTVTVNLESPKAADSLVAKASPAFLDELRRLLGLDM
jgi:hypothetical protein